MFNSSKTKHGFTLIELLVVISIIGLLSSVVFASLNTARAKARDAQRISDLRQINTAITLYFDTKGYYPICADAYVNGTTDCLSVALRGENLFSTLPIDPTYKGVNTYYNYQYWSGGNIYGLRGGFEGTPLKKTHNYPGGAGCVTSGLPSCGWYNTCVYEGYGPNCAQTQVYGSD